MTDSIKSSNNIYYEHNNFYNFVLGLQVNFFFIKKSLKTLNAPVSEHFDGINWCGENVTEHFLEINVHEKVANQRTDFADLSLFVKVCSHTTFVV